MKTTIAILAILSLFVFDAAAQKYNARKDSIKATGVTTAVMHTRGYGNYRYAIGGARPSTIHTPYAKTTLEVEFGYSTDSLRVYGITVGPGATTATDTTLTPIPLKYTVLGINTAAGVAMYRDTAVTWLSMVGTTAANAPMSGTGIGRSFDLSPYAYRDYLIGLGKNDSLTRFTIREQQ